jgi:hypothetical protein
MKRDRQARLFLSHAFNTEGRAASQIITDKLPHLLPRGIKLIVLNAVTEWRDDVVDPHQLMPVSPARLRIELRCILRRPSTIGWHDGKAAD